MQGDDYNNLHPLLYIRRKMIKFYDIDENYVKFLQKIDRQIPNIHYSTNNKFVCGVVLNIGGIEYYAPISHTTKKYQTSLLIYDKETPISSIRFSFMLPACLDVLKIKNFKEIAKIDQHYADILSAEYKYCKNNIDIICQKANAVYKIGCNKNHKLNYTCCDFKKLEEHYMEYFQ